MKSILVERYGILREKKNIAKVVPHPDGDGYAIPIGKGYVSGGPGPLGGGNIGKWSTIEKAIKQGTKHLDKKKWKIEK